MSPCQNPGCNALVDGPFARYCRPCRAVVRCKPAKYKPTPEIDSLIRELWQGSAYQRKAALVVAKRTGWPTWAVSKRAMVLGVARVTPKEPAWSAAEIDILERFAWMHPRGIRKELQDQLGTKRTCVAIVLKRKRLKLLASLDGYSATNLAGLFGIDSHKVTRWIKFGWLKAERRGSDRGLTQGGDTWWITHADVRRFVLGHPDEIDLAKAEKLWIMDVLSGGAIGIRERAA